MANRTEAFSQVKQSVVDILIRVTSVNPYARFFRSLREIEVHENTQIMLNYNPLLDQRVYNKPTTNDVVVIWPEDVSSSDCSTPHILIRGNAGDNHRIYHNYGCYDPLQYPLLFPYGECGWRQGLNKHTPGKTNATSRSDPIASCAVHTVDDFLSEEQQRSTKQRTRADKLISPREYYAYKLQIRPGNMLLLTRRSLLQFSVDMYVKTENTRLDYVRNNQETIRADLYQGLLDSFDNGERSAKNIGRRIILPPSFIGGPRDLKRRYLNAMALVQRYGKPDFFVTMTCNKKWPEIQAELLKHQTAEDRPDVEARIFRAKLLALKKKIMKDHVLGEVAALIYLVEFQKRGLPHAHFLIILEPAFRVKEPAHYDKWDPSAKEWFERIDKRICIGRPAFVLPAEGERFFLRLLLLNVRAPTSFVDLRTVGGVVYPTFQEATLQLGLLEDDNAADKGLQEASEVQLPVALRRLFAVVLVFCQARDPCYLWEKHYAALFEDYSRLHPNDPIKVKCLTVAALEEHLQALEKSLKSFNLGHLQALVPYDFRVSKEIADALNEAVPPEFIHYKDMLNERQKSVFSYIMDQVVSKKSGAFFIDGPGGTGKTFLYNALFAEVRLMNKIVLPTATSGIAAANMPNGRTAHSRFKIPVDNHSSLACDVPKQSSLAALIKEAALIIWDEASMANRCNIESLDLLLQDLCENKTLFGGKLVIFGGDFRQILLVVPRKTQKEAVGASIESSHLWAQFTKIHLIENQRAREDHVYCGFLLSLGDGNLQQVKSDYVTLPTQIVHHISRDSDSIAELISYKFPEIDNGTLTPSVFTQKAILSPLNLDVDLINSHVIDHFPGEPIVYKSFDAVLTDNCIVYPIEFINTLCPGGMSPHELILKIGCPVMLIRNLLPSAGLCNGTRLVCKAFFPNVIECVISGWQYMGQHVFIPRINLRPPSNQSYPFQFERKQFPLKLSFAMTIKKAQGQTLDQVSIYLLKPCFAHGQLYVALSRARSASCDFMWQ